MDAETPTTNGPETRTEAAIREEQEFWNVIKGNEIELSPEFKNAQVNARIGAQSAIDDMRMAGVSISEGKAQEILERAALKAVEPLLPAPPKYPNVESNWAVKKPETKEPMVSYFDLGEEEPSVDNTEKDSTSETTTKFMVTKPDANKLAENAVNEPPPKFEESGTVEADSSDRLVTDIVGFKGDLNPLPNTAEDTPNNVPATDEHGVTKEVDITPDIVEFKGNLNPLPDTDRFAEQYRKSRDLAENAANEVRAKFEESGTVEVDPTDPKVAAIVGFKGDIVAFLKNSSNEHWPHKYYSGNWEVKNARLSEDSTAYAITLASKTDTNATITIRKFQVDVDSVPAYQQLFTDQEAKAECDLPENTPHVFYDVSFKDTDDAHNGEYAVHGSILYKNVDTSIMHRGLKRSLGIIPLQGELEWSAQGIPGKLRTPQDRGTEAWRKPILVKDEVVAEQLQDLYKVDTNQMSQDSFANAALHRFVQKGGLPHDSKA